MREGKIRCPWHGACFDAKTGDIEEYPGVENIPVYDVDTNTRGDLRISIPDVMTHQKPLGTLSNSNKCIAIIGGGAAGFTCAYTLRKNNYAGRIVMVTEDWFLPYDRAKLVTNLGSDWDDIKLKDEKFYTTHKIEVIRNTTVARVDFRKHALYMRGKMMPLNYSKLLIATGMKPRTYNVPGCRLKNIYTLQTLRDSKRIREKAEGKVVVIMGSSFVAMELASSLIHLSKRTIIISKTRWPYGVTLGETVGAAILNYLIASSNNVTFRPVDEIKMFEGSEQGVVTRVVTLKKRVYDCDLVVMAMGSLPNTQFLEGTRLTLANRTGAIPVSKYMETNVKDVYAAGDVTIFPLHSSVSGTATVGHWGVACRHGRAAALNMIGIQESVSRVTPFYWTEICGIPMRYAGYGENYSESLIFGDPANMKFCVMYRREMSTLAVFTVNCDPIASYSAFDIEYKIDYPPDVYPTYITNIFKEQPFLGEKYCWWKFRDETNLGKYDSRRIRKLPRGSERKNFDTSSEEFDLGPQTV